MRHLYLILVSVLPICAFGQVDTLKLPERDGKITYEGVVELGNDFTQTNLYAAAKKWMSGEFVSDKSIIQSENNQTGSLMGKGFVEGSRTSKLLSETYIFPYKVYMTLQVDTKQGKYRYRFSDFEYQENIPRERFTRERKEIRSLAEIYSEYHETKPTKKSGKPKDGNAWDRETKSLGLILQTADSKVKELINSLEKAMRASKSDDF